MKKVILSIATAGVVGFGSLFFSSPVLADTLEDLEKKEEQIKQERKDLKATLSDTESEVADILIELEEINAEIEQNAQALEENQAAIKENENDIEDTQSEIDQLEEEIVALEKEIETRFEILKDRASAYQRSGGNSSYLEMLFGSQSFMDFISRVGVITKITEADARIMEQIEEDKVKVEEKQAEILVKLDELEELRSELEGIQALIKDQKKEMKKKQANLEEKEEKLAAKVKDLEMEDSKLASLEDKVKNSIAVLNQPPPPPSAAGGNLSTLSSQSNGGYLAWPAVGGYISSYVGPRWGRMHNGIDIARPSNYNILAAADGTVTKAGYTGGYGNRIEIQHSNGIKTLYAHLSSINVSVGQTVSTGTVIGIMGKTGNSTGIHLHFEVYKNGALQNPMDYLR